MSAAPLPPLPEPYRQFPGLFTEGQMQAYATAARAELESENAELKRKLEEARALLQGIVETAADMARAALEEQP